MSWRALLASLAFGAALSVGCQRQCFLSEKDYHDAHGRILPSIYFFRDRDIVVITSDNFDGEWTAKIIHRFGFTTARGSTSRNATRAALKAKRRMEEGHAVGITVDGPRGPALVAQPGAV